MRALVCGSRVWPDHEVVEHVLLDLKASHGEMLTVVHGGAKGADVIAHDCCMRNNIKVEVFLADWERYGRGAGYHRNTKMLNTGPNLVVAFHMHNSPGTKHTITQAEDREIPVLVVLPRASRGPVR